VHSLDEFFHRKYEEDEATEQIHQVATYEDVMRDEATRADTNIHMPSPSYWPIVLAIGLPIIAYGIIFTRLLAVFGAVVVLLAMFGWSMEPSVAPESDYDPPVDGGSTKELATLG
jgi:cytochrome c oxidase subunit 1